MDNPYYTEKICLQCNGRFLIRYKRVEIGRGIYCSKTCMIQNKLNPKTFLYKGGGYSSIHKWIVRKFGKATMCENVTCPKKCLRYHWANLSGKYLHTRKDWKQLCQSCHFKMDMNKSWIENAIRGRLNSKSEHGL